MKYEVDTRIMDGRFIESEILDIGYVDIVHRTMKYVLDVQEEQVKQSLIKLGWTPPKEQNSNFNESFNVLNVMLDKLLKERKYTTLTKNYNYLTAQILILEEAINNIKCGKLL